MVECLFVFNRIVPWYYRTVPLYCGTVPDTTELFPYIAGLFPGITEPSLIIPFPYFVPNSLSPASPSPGTI